MSKVNFVSEFNLLMRYARNNGLSMRERMLWIALFYIANDRATYNEQTKDYDWPDGFIPVSNGELNLYCCLDKRAIDTLRNSLKQRGLIDFTPGLKNKRNPAYRLNYLSVNVGYKNVPNDVPNHDTNDVPNHVPNDAPKDAPNNAPNTPPYPKYKQYPCENQPEMREAAVHVKRNGAGKARADSDFGFVDLNDENCGEAGFVPLPWEDGL